MLLCDKMNSKSEGENGGNKRNVMERMTFSPHGKMYVQYLETSERHDMSIQHYHDSYEIYFQLQGKRHLFLDNICYTLERGDVAIFKPFDIHYAQSRDVEFYGRYVMNFQDELLMSILKKEEVKILLGKLPSCVIHLPESEIGHLHYEFQKAEQYGKKGGFLTEQLQATAVLQVITLLMEYMDDTFIVKGKKISSQIIEVLDYIQFHYRESITLDEIAETIHMSKYYLCRTFHQVTGATVLEYINNVRLMRAHTLLIHTKDSIEEIAVQTGFSSSSNLARVFKKSYGISPRAFRKKRAKEK